MGETIFTPSTPTSPPDPLLQCQRQSPIRTFVLTHA